MNKQKRESHPAYGVVSVSRVSGVRTLVGSEVEHQHWFMIELREADRYEDDGGIRYSGAGKKSVVSFCLSASQFVDMVSGVGLGDGIPCTIRAVDGEMREQPKRELSRVELAAEWGKARVEENTQKMKDNIARIMDICSSLPQKKQKEICDILNWNLDVQMSNSNFYVSRIVEAAESAVSFAKTEVENYASAVVRALGIRQLKDLDQKVLEAEKGGRGK